MKRPDLPFNEWHCFYLRAWLRVRWVRTGGVRRTERAESGVALSGGEWVGTGFEDPEMRVPRGGDRTLDLGRALPAVEGAELGKILVEPTRQRDKASGRPVTLWPLVCVCGVCY